MAKFKMRTSDIKALASAISGKVMLPVELSDYVAIEIKNNTMTLWVTDGNNYLYVCKDKIDAEDFYAVVPLDRFQKLISRMTTDEVSISVSGTKMIIKGNGKYVLDLRYDVDGELLEYPDPLKDLDYENWEHKAFNLTTLNVIKTVSKAALLVDKDLTNPYTGYFLGDSVITTDTLKINRVNIPVLDEPKILMPTTFQMLEAINTEAIDIYYKDDKIVFATPNVQVYGEVVDVEIADPDDEESTGYPLQAINDRFDAPYPSYCVIDRNAVLSVLNRVRIFVDQIDENGIYLTFTKDGINVCSKSNTGDEVITYVELNSFKDFRCSVDIVLFEQQVRACRNNRITMYFGRDDIIKFQDGNVTQILALEYDGEDDEEE